MKIVFSMVRIRDKSLLYKTSDKNVDDEENNEEYCGDKYCNLIIDDIMSKIKILHTKDYKGALECIANEVFEIFDDKGISYRIDLKISTYNNRKDNNDHLTCTITSINTDSYNINLEKLKISLKNRLLRDWRNCTWHIDEQAALLCNKAYFRAYTIETYLKSFVSKVMIHHLGYFWIHRFGFENYKISIDKHREKFIQRVPEFDDINTDFMSMSLETLSKIMYNSVMYREEQVLLDRSDLNKIRNKASSNQSAQSVLDTLRLKLKKECVIWDDIFLKYINDSESFKDSFHNFIQDRNHIAHCKILLENSFDKMMGDFDDFENRISLAESCFESLAYSNEYQLTKDIEYESLREIEREKEYYEQYYRERLSSETGMSILNEDMILQWFDKNVSELYDKVYRHYNLDKCYDISKLRLPSQTNDNFIISSDVISDGSGKIKITTEYDLDDGLGGNSYCTLFCKNSSDSVLSQATIRFHNGSGYENEEGIMVVSESTEYDDSELADFLEDIFKYVYLMNPYPQLLSALSYSNKGVVEYIADFSCERCGKRGVSINDEFLPKGKCCYCGYENEIVICKRCGSIVDAYFAENGFCPSCASYIDKQ